MTHFTFLAGTWSYSFPPSSTLNNYFTWCASVRHPMYVLGNFSEREFNLSLFLLIVHCFIYIPCLNLVNYIVFNWIIAKDFWISTLPLFSGWKWVRNKGCVCDWYTPSKWNSGLDSYHCRIQWFSALYNPLHRAWECALFCKACRNRRSVTIWRIVTET